MSWDIVDKLIIENISAVGISGDTGISEAWIQQYVNKKYEDAPNQTEDVFKKTALFFNVMKYGLLPDQRRIKTSRLLPVIE